jgi:DNA-directed RNA polymerase subunit alpha
LIEKNWKELVKPSKLDVETSDDKSYAKITVEPLEKGFALNSWKCT